MSRPYRLRIGQTEVGSVHVDVHIFERGQLVSRLVAVRFGGDKLLQQQHWCLLFEVDDHGEYTELKHKDLTEGREFRTLKAVKDWCLSV